MSRPDIAAPLATSKIKENDASRRERWRLGRHRSSLIVSLLVAALSVLLWPPFRTPGALAPFARPLQQMEWAGYESLMSLRGQLFPNRAPQTIVIGYDHDTELALKQDWPPPRAFHARVIDNLTRAGARVIVFDVLFTGPSAHGASDDQAFDRALGRSGHVALACAINRDLANKRKSFVAPYSADEGAVDFESRSLCGFAELPTDDGTVRRIAPVQSFQDAWVPSLAAAALLAEQQKTARDLRVTDRGVQIGSVTLPATGPIEPDPVDLKHLPSVYVDFGNATDLTILRYEEAYWNRIPAESLRGKTVFVGVTGSDLTKQTGERFRSSSSRFGFLSDGAQRTPYLPGVVLQAQALEAMRRGNAVGFLPPVVLGALVFAFGALASLTARRYVDVRGPALLALCVLGYIAAAVGVFLLGGFYAPPVVVPPSLILLGSGALVWMERGRLRRRWAGFVSPDVLEYILRHEAGTEPRRYEATIVFGDVRGFTSFSERHEPEKVVRLLNRRLTEASRLILSGGGTIDKYLGDGIMFGFGAPKPMADAAIQAVRTAWLVNRASLTPITDDDGAMYELEMGLGVATGPLIFGEMGSPDHHEATYIGNTVNLASRLQGVTGRPDVILDAPTLARVAAHVDVEPLGEMVVKGKAQPVACFKVIAWHEKARPRPPTTTELVNTESPTTPTAPA